MHSVLVLMLLMIAWSPANADAAHEDNRSEYRAPESAAPLTIDGVADEPVWAQAEWRPINQRWLGPEYSAEDFQGRYKIVLGLRDDRTGRVVQRRRVLHRVEVVHVEVVGPEPLQSRGERLFETRSVRGLDSAT